MEIKDKALEVIEVLLLLEHSEDKLKGKIYRIAHVANNDCKNPHENWKQELEDTYQHLVEIGEIKPR